MRILLNLLSISLALYAPRALADDNYAHALGLTDTLLHLNLISVAIWSFVALLFIVLGAIVVNPKKEFGKHFFFWSIAVVSIAITALFIVQTTIKNVLSETGGPVHWHADFRIFKCNEELDLLDPTGLLNRIGTPTVHEHNDKRIHIEGTMMSLADASLGNFFKVIGGNLTKDELIVPTNYGMAEMQNGDICVNAKVSGELQVFLWSVNAEDNRATQRKLENFEEYVPSPHSPVPPGDCIIIEFGARKDATEHLCEQYRVAKKNSKILLDDSLLMR